MLAFGYTMEPVTGDAAETGDCSATAHAAFQALQEGLKKPFRLAIKACCLPSDCCMLFAHSFVLCSATSLATTYRL
ncbi:unnamed protein product [Protopolystoma xenopodis]|uniref:Uncharacterized protein n=1 Tax=Protopolystoma xenopodis TaxID=117903 RepID=A0A3S5AMY4_9PLAT|nr:unnamed protein product [Protopolystoma xenopodis]